MQTSMKEEIRITSDCHWEGMSWDELKKKLETDPEYKANLEVARRIINNYEAVVNYYIGPMSALLVEKINRIMGENFYADFYLFLSSPFVNNIPEWHKISLYEAKDCNLQSYTSLITCRHFYKLAKKEKKKKNNEVDLLEYKDYESLLLCDQAEDDGESLTQARMRKAFAQLSEKDKLVLTCLVIKKMPAIDAYPMVEDMIHPLAKNGMTSDQVKSNWSVKQRQDAMSLMKGRALNHLLIKYNEQKN